MTGLSPPARIALLVVLLTHATTTTAAPGNSPGSQYLDSPAPRGYDFTISASATDPQETEASSTGGIRQLYLWMVCANPGLAALECQATGTLSIMGFEPLNGVMNVGDAQHLLLAVPNCPSGSGIDLLLGKWTVNDQGGTLCLGAPASGDFTAVDCDPIAPGTAFNPAVKGFSSSGLPCIEGEQGCFEEEPGTIVFEETASVPGFLTYGESWSPTNSFVAVSAPTGTTLIDPTTGSSRELGIQAREIQWSPDGSCASLVFMEQDHRTTALAVVRAADGAMRVIGRGEDFTHQAWTGDGRPYSWRGDGSARAFSRPDIWQPPGGYVSEAAEDLVAVVADPTTQRIGYKKFSRATARETTFVARDLPHDVEFLVMASCDRPPLALAFVLGNATYAGRTVLLSVKTGETLLEFVPHGFFGTSLARSGQWVVGHVELSRDEHAFEGSEIWIASRTGHWIRSLGGVAVGMNPKCSNRGDWIAFDDPTTHSVRIGRLQVMP